MRGPSAKILSQAGGGNLVSIYPAIGGPDIDGGPQYIYAPAPSMWDVPASCQFTDTGEVEDLGRVSQVNWFKVVFGFNPKTKPRDKIVWIERGTIHNLIVWANPPSEAGRGSAFILRCHEYI
jgi:hypothetical protein